MTAGDPIRMGGLMRCCIASVHDASRGREGDEIGCKYHKDPDTPQIRFRDGAWEWIGPQENPGSSG